MEREVLKHILALTLIKGVGAVSIKKSLLFVKAYAGDWKKLAKMGSKVNEENLSANFSRAEEILDACEASNTKLISLIDEAYPSKLLALKDPPPILYYKGNFELIHQVIGIVGTQQSSNLGNAIAQRTGTYFSKEWSICSGLQAGIDSHSILGSDGKMLPNVIGVLPAGLNYQHTVSLPTQQLADEVLGNGGLLLSEFEPNQAEDQFSGGKSSRIQAGISHAIVLIQSPMDSDAKYTLRAFAPLNRPLGVIEFSTNPEYTSHTLFEANRLILEKGDAGVLEFCIAKKTKNLAIKEIISIGKKEDYLRLEESAVGKLK